MRPAREVADIFRRHGPAYRLGHDGHLGRIERRVMAAIKLCHTPALGGHIEACDDCGHSRVSYNSCRNRHYPKCQGIAPERWLVARNRTYIITTSRMICGEELMVDAADDGLPVGSYSDEAMAAEIEALFASRGFEPNSGIQQLLTAEGAHVVLLPVVDYQRRGVTIVLWRLSDTAPFGAKREGLLASLSEPLRRSLQIYYRIMDLTRRSMLGDRAQHQPHWRRSRRQ